MTEDDLHQIAAGGMVDKSSISKTRTTPYPNRANPTTQSGVQHFALTILWPWRGHAAASLPSGTSAVARSRSKNYSPRTSPACVQQNGEIIVAPSRPPVLPAHCFQLFDPGAGPRVPHEELVKDGGDVGPRIGIGPSGKIGNLDTTDAAADFRYGAKDRRTSVSNRICLFAPRFAVIRQEVTPSSVDISVGTSKTISAAGTVAHASKQPVTAIHENVPPMATVGRLSPHLTEMREGIRSLDLFVGWPLLLGRVDGTSVKVMGIEPITLTQYRDQCKSNEPLVLVKSATPKEAQPGDVVTITLKFINYGNRPARDLAINDNLSPRLEYVDGSSKGDRPTVFTIQDNKEGSAILRWEIVGELPPGQSGIVQFQVKVR